MGGVMPSLWIRLQLFFPHQNSLRARTVRSQAKADPDPNPKEGKFSSGSPGAGGAGFAKYKVGASRSGGRVRKKDLGPSLSD